jgi:hypothetical protein
MAPSLPTARGPLGSHVIDRLRRPPHTVPPGPAPPAAPLDDEDLQLTLYVLYELHYQGFAGVDDAWEWEPSLLAERGRLERAFEGAVRAIVGTPGRGPGESVEDALRRLIAADDGPPLARFIETQASLDQLREFIVHRSAYQLKEADPHTFGIPRITGAPKAAMVEIQADEYGGGRAERMHAALFAAAMAELGLDETYGAYLGAIPARSLATVNLMSLLGLHRRWRGAIVGHLAAFEMTSCLPNRRYANGLRRLGLGPRATAFFDEHVEADAVHDMVAAHDLAQGLAEDEPELAGDVLFGAAALLALDARAAGHVLDSWRRGESSLHGAADAAMAAAGPAPAGAPR